MLSFVDVHSCLELILSSLYEGMISNPTNPMVKDTESDFLKRDQLLFF